MIHVVVGILFNAQGNVLLAQRQQQKFQGGRWEFPGGKVELNENPLAALQRELHEEIGIDSVVANPWLQLQHSYSDKDILLDVWLVTEFRGEPHGKEGQDVRWVEPQNLFTFAIPDANIPIVNEIMKHCGV